MPCEPIDLSKISVPQGSGAGIVPKLPNFDLPQPPADLEDLSAIFNNLIMVLPFGTILQPHLSFGPDKNIFDGIKDFLRYINIFLIPLKFIIPILQMILCIIEVLCALLNPFKLSRALRRLFRKCIPAVLSLFPQAALILVIIALLLLIIELIAYLIQRIISLIKQIAENLETLADSIKSFDSDSVIAIVQKVGDLLCTLQSFFVLFGVILLIIEVIQQLLSLFFKLPPCDGGDKDGCCDSSVCPDFIKNNEEIKSNTGTLLYLNKVIQVNAGGVITVVRTPSYQFFDPSAAFNKQFNNITHAYDLPQGMKKVFFPKNQNYANNADPIIAPYTVDLRFYYDPAIYGRTDPKGARMIQIKDCVVISPPQDGVATFDNKMTGPYNGTCFLAGGEVKEDNEVDAVIIDGKPAKLETLLFQSDSIVLAEGFNYPNISYTFKINHEILAGDTLITIGCMPEVAFDINAINNTIVRQTNNLSDQVNKIAKNLPDVRAAQDCISLAIAKFRQNITVESSATLQKDLIACLNDLNGKAKDSLNEILGAAFNPYGSSFTIDPTIQFTTLPITVSVSLNESGGGGIANNLPSDVAETLAQKIEARATLGKVGKFTYDGSSKFTAPLTSPDAGNGKISISYDNQFISTFTNPDDIDETPTIEIKELDYTFVYAVANTGNDGKVRRDEEDVANG